MIKVARMMICVVLGLALFELGGLSSSAEGQDSPFGQVGSFGGVNQTNFGDSRDRVGVTATPARTKVTPGTELPIAVIFDHQPRWHIWTNEGNSPEGSKSFEGAIHTEIKAAAPLDPRIKTLTSLIQWPEPHIVSANLGEGPQNYAVFSGRAIAYVPLIVASDAQLGPVNLKLLVTFQSCDDSTCLAPVFDHELSVTLEVVNDAPTDAALSADFKGFDPSVFEELRSAPVENTSGSTGNPSAAPALESGGRTFFGIPLPQTEGAIGLLLLILLSMLGGFVLNLTPCVLPIIPIKILTISQHAGTPGRSFVLGVWMALGVVAFWAGIGIPVAAFSGAIDPSQVFGIWWVTLGIGLLIGLMGVGIMGLFDIRLPDSLYAVNPKADTPWGSFLFGVMTAVLGLPCFGFVAGALLAGAVTLPPLIIMLVFTSLGVGMAAPYLLLAAKPAWVKRIPRTGPASELVKQVMGLLLLAAAAYFAGSGLITLVIDYPYLGKQLHWWIVALFSVASGGWLIIRTFQISNRPVPRFVFGVTGLIVGAIAVLFAANVTSTAKHEWESRQAAAGSDEGFLAGAWNEYTPARFEAAREAGHVVVLDFTASWCLTCQVLRRTVLDPEPVRTVFAQKDVVVFEVDLSSRSAVGWKTLNDLGKTGIPLLAVYAPGSNTPWLANAYTAGQVVEAVNGAREKRAAANRWTEWTPQRFELARRSGRPVVVDFDAAWLPCGANTIREQLIPLPSTYRDCEFLRADVTSSTSPGWKFLRDLDRKAIPLLAIFTPGSDTPWLADFYTETQLASAIEQARADATTHGH